VRTIVTVVNQDSITGGMPPGQEICKLSQRPAALLLDSTPQPLIIARQRQSARQFRVLRRRNRTMESPARFRFKRLFFPGFNLRTRSRRQIGQRKGEECRIDAN
jgi:hypothetical protein